MTLSSPTSTAEGKSLGVAFIASVMLLSGCGEDPSAPGDTDPLFCSIDESLIASGGVSRDGIPSLQDPALVGPFDAGVEYLLPEAFVSFWFSWAAFHPATTLWLP